MLECSMCVEFSFFGGCCPTRLQISSGTCVASSMMILKALGMVLDLDWDWDWDWVWSGSGTGTGTGTGANICYVKAQNREEPGNNVLSA